MSTFSFLICVCAFVMELVGRNCVYIKKFYLTLVDQVLYSRELFGHLFNKEKFDLIHFSLSEEEEGQPRSKKQLIALAKEIANASRDVSAYASKVAKDCPDRRVSQVNKHLRAQPDWDTGGEKFCRPYR